MTPTVVLLTAFSILLDVIGQLAFKLGLDRLPEHEGGFRLRRFWVQIAGAPMLWFGVGAYVVEFITWLLVLSLAPLSLVFGSRLKGLGSDIIDAVALFALIAGVAASLGAGMMSISLNLLRCNQ